jgi:hypothetical protein
MNIFYSGESWYSCVINLCVYIWGRRDGLLAWGTPGIDIEVFSSYEPVHTTLLWSCWNKEVFLTGALFAGGVYFFTEIGIIVIG